MITRFAVWLFLFLPASLFSQQKLDDPARHHPVSIRSNLFGLIDLFDGNLSGGVEYGLGRRTAVAADLGIIFYSVYVNNNNRLSLGYHFKPTVRYYFTDRRRGFFDAGLFYKQVGYHVEDWLEKDIINGVASYEEFQKFVYRKRVLGLQLMSGYKAPLNKQETLWLEFYGGLSVRTKWQDVKNMPNAAYRRGFSLFDEQPQEKSSWPGVPMGMRLVIRIN